MQSVYIILILFILIIVIAYFFGNAALTLYCGAAEPDCGCGEPSRAFGAAQEIEARFLDIDYDKTIAKLKEIGATQVYPQREFNRTVYSLPNGYARVRDEGDSVTLTVKKYSKDSKYPEEFELEVKDSYEDAVKFMSSLDLEQKAIQQTKREKWSIDGCTELVIDDIPGLATYIEIECKDEEKVFEIAEKLGFKKADAQYGAYAKVFESEYGIPAKVINDETPVLSFKNLDDLLPLVKKNKEKFMKIKKEQEEKYT